VWIRFNVTPNGISQVDNTAEAKGTSPKGTIVSDDSQDGLKTDPDNDNDPSNNNVPTPVIFPIGADLKVTKLVSADTAVVGTTVDFTILVENLGPSNVTGIELTDDLPNGYTYVSSSVSTGSYSPTTDIWTLGSLTNGSSATLTITVLVNAPGTGVNFSNTATVTLCDQNDTDTTNNHDSATVYQDSCCWNL
jgi:uncharacterized repeat protein (TIGR01451 family)